MRTEPHIPVLAASSGPLRPLVIPCQTLPPPGSYSPDELWLSLQCSGPQKLLHIAQELLRTEETYVRRLHLLDQVAHVFEVLPLSTTRALVAVSEANSAC